MAERNLPLTTVLRDFEMFFQNEFDDTLWEYPNIVVDEAQDFPSALLEHLALLAELHDGAFYLFYDRGQTIISRRPTGQTQQMAAEWIDAYMDLPARSLSQLPQYGGDWAHGAELPCGQTQELSQCHPWQKASCRIRSRCRIACSSRRRFRAPYEERGEAGTSGHRDPHGEHTGKERARRRDVARRDSSRSSAGGGKGLVHDGASLQGTGGEGRPPCGCACVEAREADLPTTRLRRQLTRFCVS